MRAFLPSYDLVAPSSLGEALALLAEGHARPFAGGTDLMVLLESGKLPEGRFVGLWKLDDLRGIDDRGESVTIGALTTYSDVLRDARLRAEWPLLCDAAAETGGVATQNRGTLGGNIANASPAADTPPALLVYDAEVEVASARGTRRVPYDRFHLGYKSMDLARDELITRIHLPRRPSRWMQYYRKVGTRRAQAISKVCVAIAAHQLPDGRIEDVRIALGSVAPAVIRARGAESVLRGRLPDALSVREAQNALARDINPIDDIRSTARYRLRTAQALLADAWLGARPLA